MAQKKLLVVVGALGTQGRAITDHFLSEEKNQYTVRGLTRNASSEKARALVAKGVDVVQADLGDLASLKKAFHGAHAIFAYTDSAGAATSNEARNLFQAGDYSELAEAAGQIEEQHGRNIAIAAGTTSSLERLIWSTTQDPVKASDGRMPTVYELSAKARIWEYMRSLRLLDRKLSAVTFSIFADSIIRFPELFGWTKKGPGSYALRLPIVDSKSRLPWIDLPRDAGQYVSALLKAPGGLEVGAVGGYISLDEALEKVKDKYGIKISVETISKEEITKVDSSGLLWQAALLLQSAEDYGIAGPDSDVIYAAELRERGYGMKQSSVQDAFAALDWTPLL